jgi:enoyl-CoA hydratase
MMRTEVQDTTMTANSVLRAQVGGVAVLSLNEPQTRNALSPQLVAEISSAFDAAEADASVRCVVLTSEGRAFCAGAQLGALRCAADGDFDSVKAVYEGFLRVYRSPLPTIAAVNGPAVGAGFNLALACDVRLAGQQRARFDTRFAQLRIHPGGGHAWLLARAVGQQRATMACLFGEEWDADAALAAGLVAAVHPDDELRDAAVALGARLNDQDPEFVRRLTATLRESLVTIDHEVALARETVVQQWSTTRPAFLAGVKAIEEKVARKS